MNQRKFLLYLGYAVALLSTLSLLFLSQATQGSENFESYYKPLLITVAVGIFCLVIIVVFHLFRLGRSFFKKQAGASLSLTILFRSLLLAFIPLVLTSYFSFKFLNYEFQSSFDEGINDALNNALVLSKKALNVRGFQALQDSKDIANEVKNYDYNRLLSRLNYVRQRFGAYELTVIDEKGFIQAFASADISTTVPNLPEYSEFNHVDNQGGLFSLDAESNLNLNSDKGKSKDNFQIRTLVPIDKPNSPNYYLQAIFHITDTVSELTDQVNRTISERDRFNYLMPRVNSSFIVVLVLVVLLSVLLLILSSISFANDMAKPIRDLVRGTKRVSKGDFSQPLLTKRRDDFGTLMRSFNNMTHSLKNATEEIEHNRDRIESERAYLETVINHMTAGVFAIDYEYRLQTYNDRAEGLLGIDLSHLIYQESRDFLDVFHRFVSEIMASYQRGKASEIEVSIEVNEETVTFIGNVTPLPSTDNLHGGYVIIFEVLGQYLQQQKKAAWEEVARRLAHEIKNPLTPILLATDRLNYKLSGHLDEKQQQILSRSVEVITNQVKSLKEMVNDFSDFAKPVNLQRSNLSFATLLEEIFDLYLGHYQGIEFHLDNQAENDLIEGNAQVLRQVLHNLIKNAIEACEMQREQTDNDQENKNQNKKSYTGKITLLLENKLQRLCLSVIDNGTGLPDQQSVFEPYVTTKEKGTGLGLAIVKKMIQEHQGTVKLINRQEEQGVVVLVSLPLS